MNKSQILILILFLFSGKLLAQDQDSVTQMKEYRKTFLFYKHLYKAADSLDKNAQIGFLNNDIYRVSDSLDKLHSQEYFLKAGKLLASDHLNEASFIFYLGRLRYRYYNSVNPNYKESEDGALLGALTYQLGEPIDMF